MRRRKKLIHQKINVTNELLQYWRQNFISFNSPAITESRLNINDLNTDVEFENYSFEIIGETPTNQIILKNIDEYNNIFYFEVSKKFVQMLLGRFNKDFNGNDIPYKKSDLIIN